MTTPLTPLAERILEHIVVDASGCWLWTRSLTGGYGQMFLPGPNGRRVNRRVHRLLYTELIGPIPVGMQLDHTCHNADEACPGGVNCRHRRCVNPAHLEPVTNRENTLRGRCGETNRERQIALEACKAGHPFVGQNVRITPDGRRVCRTCARVKTRRYANHGARGPRRLVVGRRGATVRMECGHTKTLHNNPKRAYKYALCPTCEAELGGND